MTNDFKEQLLNYLTGTIEIETPPENPTYYKEIETIANNLYTNITNEIGNNNFEIINVIQSKTNSNIVINGKSTSNNNSFLIVTDENFNILSYFDKFSSGVSFRTFTGFNVDENGYFYTIESDHGLYLNNKRFLLLNNIAVPNASGEYEVKIRKSYAVPNTTVLYNNSIQGLYKAVGQSIYVILSANSSANRYLTKLTINVGASNDWEDNAINGVVGDDQILSVDSEGNILFKTITTGVPISAYTYGISIYTYNNGTQSTTTITDTTITGMERRRSIAKFKNINEAYIGYKLFDTANTYSQYVINYFDLTTNAITTIYNQNDIYVSDLIDINFLTFYRVDNEMLFKLNIITNATTLEFNIIIGRLININIQTEEIAQSVTPLTTNVDFFIVTKNFNLYQYLVQYNNNLYSTKEVYQINGYNGDNYIDTNCLIPKISYLYSNNSLVFARTLYNKQVNGNTTTSTVEVPYNYLNEISIQPKQLLGQTNMILNNDTNSITKNIYETLDINFINTITMQNNDNSINLMGATRLNASATSTNDYSNAQIGYYRLNYTDGTTEDFKINPSEYTPTDEYSGAYNFVVYVKKALSNINILSNDKTTVYATLNLVLEVGKYYKINQNVEVV